MSTGCSDSSANGSKNEGYRVNGARRENNCNTKGRHRHPRAVLEWEWQLLRGQWALQIESTRVEIADTSGHSSAAIEDEKRRWPSL